MKCLVDKVTALCNTGYGKKDKQDVREFFELQVLSAIKAFVQ